MDTGNNQFLKQTQHTSNSNIIYRLGNFKTKQVHYNFTNLWAVFDVMSLGKAKVTQVSGGWALAGFGHTQAQLTELVCQAVSH